MHGISPINDLHVLMVSPEFDYISVGGHIQCNKFFNYDLSSNIRTEY